MCSGSKSVTLLLCPLALKSKSLSTPYLIIRLYIFYSLDSWRPYLDRHLRLHRMLKETKVKPGHILCTKDESFIYKEFCFVTTRMASLDNAHAQRIIIIIIFLNTHMNTCTSQKHFFSSCRKMRHSHSRIHRCIFPPSCVLIWSIFGLCTHGDDYYHKKKVSSCFLETPVALLHFFPPSVRFPSFPSFHFPFL